MCVCVSAAILAQFCEIKRFTSFTFSVLDHVKSHESHEDHQEGCSASTGNEGHESDEGPHVLILARTFLKRRWPDLPGSKLMTKSSFEPLREKCLISKLKFKTWVRATFAFLLTRRGAERPTPHEAPHTARDAPHRTRGVRPRPIARQPAKPHFIFAYMHTLHICTQPYELMCVYVCPQLSWLNFVRSNVSQVLLFPFFTMSKAMKAMKTTKKDAAPAPAMKAMKAMKARTFLFWPARF